jgi:hypothetical protein
MKCKKAIELIYLADEIEISRKVKTDFDNHLKSCDACRKEFQIAESYRRAATIMKNHESVIQAQPEFTDAVMREIRSEKRKQYGLSATLENIIYKSSVRIAFSAVIIFFTVLFFAQEFEAMKKINRLEIEFLKASADENDVVHNLNASSLEPLYEMYKLLDGEKKYVNLPADWMLIKKSEIRKLLAEYGSYIENKNNLVLVNKSELLSLLENTNRDEVKRMIENKDILLTKLYPVFPGGEHKNEK